MSGEKPHRLYIRRKRCLKESQKLIYETLCSIVAMKGQEVNSIQLSQEALEHATAIEASCWSPRLHISDEEFHQLTIKKTQDLCYILIQRSCQPHSYTPIALPQPKKVKKVQALSLPPDNPSLFQAPQMHPISSTPPSFNNNVMLPSITEFPMREHVVIPSISNFDQPQKNFPPISPQYAPKPSNLSQQPVQYGILVPSTYIINFGSS